MAQRSSFQSLINDTKPVLIDFHATWCGPCKAMAPILKELARETGETIRILKIDIDKNEQLANKLDIRGVPTFILYREGKQLWRQSGMVTKAELTRVINKHKN